jgi:glycosyltransferase involved in cell wall biosynthesis
MIMVGVPTYDGRVEWKTMASLIGLGHLCAKANVGYGMDVIPGNAFIGHARNMLVQRFLNGNFRDLLFVDADISFHPMDAVKLCKAEPEVVFGLYRKREDRLVYPGRYHEPLEVHPSDPDLIRMLWGPTGFMRFRRSVFEKMMEEYPDDWYEDGETGERIYDFFPNGGTKEHKFISEDVSFCERADKIGVKVWAMQGLALSHTGTKTWESVWKRTEAVFEEAV